MKSLIKNKIAKLLRKQCNNEGGFALVLSLVVLTVLALLGVSAVITSQIDVQIAGNEKVSLQALHAAESGLAQALVMLNESTAAGAKVVDPTPATWPADDDFSYTIPIALTDENGDAFFNVSVTISYKKDGQCDQGNIVTFYNHTCGFSDALNAVGGSPVYVLNSVAYKGDYRSELSLELTKQELAYNIKGGFSANGGVTVNGNITLDGRDHNIDGSLGNAGCTHDNLTGMKPAIFSNGSTEYNGNPNLESDLPEAVSNNNTNSPGTPWDALGMSQTQFTGLFANKVDSRAADGTLSGYTWVNGDFGNIGGTGNDMGGNGILVVHNEDFNASDWGKFNQWGGNASTDVGDCTIDAGDTSRPDNATEETLCNQYNADNTKYEPARLGNVGGGTFDGIIIADWIDSFQGNTKINGAVVSLTTLDVSAIGAGTVELNYSCAAIEAYGGGRNNKKLNWKRVY